MKKSEAFQMAELQVRRDLVVTAMDGLARNPIYAGIAGVVANGLLARAGLIDEKTAGLFNAAIITGAVLSSPIGDSAVSGLTSLAGFAAKAVTRGASGLKVLAKKASKKIKDRRSIIQGDFRDLGSEQITVPAGRDVLLLE